MPQLFTHIMWALYLPVGSATAAPPFGARLAPASWHAPLSTQPHYHMVFLHSAPASEGTCWSENGEAVSPMLGSCRAHETFVVFRPEGAGGGGLGIP